MSEDVGAQCAALLGGRGRECRARKRPADDAGFTGGQKSLPAEIFDIGAGLVLFNAVADGIKEVHEIFVPAHFLADDADVAAAGMHRVTIMGFSYMISAFMDCTIAASRGLGKSLVPTGIVILGSCVFRVAWVYTIFAYFRTIPSLYLLYIFSWTLTAVAEIIYFIIIYRKMVSSMSGGGTEEPTCRQTLG